MKNKILIIVDHLGEGGTQRQILEYLKFASRDRFGIKIVTLSKKTSSLIDEIKKLGYEIITIKQKGFFNPVTILRLVRLFKREKPDIVYTFLFTADSYARLAAKLAGVKVIISSIRNVDIWKRWHHILADRILARWTDRITVNAENIRPFLVKNGIPEKKIVTIYNGIDLNRCRVDALAGLRVKEELGIPKDALVVGMVARFSAQKDYETFFKAAKRVNELNPNVYFVAVGDGPERTRFESQYAQRNTYNVIFTGSRKDIPDLINAMDVCVLSSHYEGCPNVILEYMACSKPVIASNVGGCSELVADKETGFIVPTKDTVSLTAKILQLINDPYLMERMGKEGRKRAEKNFSLKVMVENTENLYKELLRPKIAYILSQFPVTSETFILREIEALQKKSIQLKIFSLKACRDKVIHPEAREFMKRTVYGRICSLSSIVYGLKHTIKACKAFSYVVRIYRKNLKDLIKAIYVFLECLYFTRYIRKEGVTHIHGHWATMPTTAAVVLSKLTEIPFSFTAHAWDIFTNTNGLVDKIEGARFVVTCTDYNRKFLSSLSRDGQYKKIYLNYHGIDLERFKSPATNALAGKQVTRSPGVKILAIGRLVETKGFEHLIDACEILRCREINFECQIVGEGPLGKSLKSQVAGYGLGEYVKFMGVRTQDAIRQLYGQATVLVQPSVMARGGDRDGIPNVILEAMAMGLPVVSTNLSGIPEVAVNNLSGILVPEKDSNALADAIEHLTQNKPLRETLSRNARQLIEEKFDIHKNIQELINIFQNNGV